MVIVTTLQSVLSLKVACLSEFKDQQPRILLEETAEEEKKGMLTRLLLLLTITLFRSAKDMQWQQHIDTCPHYYLINAEYKLNKQSTLL